MRHLGALDNGLGRDVALKARSLEKDEMKICGVLRGNDAMNVNLLVARDDGPERVGNRDSLVSEGKKGKWTLALIVVSVLESVGCFVEFLQDHHAIRPKRCPPRRASGLGLLVLASAVLLAVRNGKFCEENQELRKQNRFMA